MSKSSGPSRKKITERQPPPSRRRPGARYLLDAIPQALYEEATRKAAALGLPLRTVLLTFLRAFVEGQVTINIGVTGRATMDIEVTER